MKNPKKQIKDEIFLKIQVDLPLRKKIADLCMIHHMSVRQRCLTKSPKMAHPKTIELIKKETGWSDSDIFKPQND